MSATDVHVSFAGVRAVDGVDVQINSGEVLGLIGPNGAGKTTLVNAITGFQRMTAGVLKIGDVDVSKWSPARLSRFGVARTFQAVRLFANLTVGDNLAAAAAGMGLGGSESRACVEKTVAMVGLDVDLHEPARALSAGAGRRVGLARAVATSPRFLLLDEPTAGLNEEETDDFLTAVRTVRDELGCGILVIEHDMRVITELCDRVQVLDFGQTLATGTPHEVRADERVIAAYLGPHASA